MERIFAEENGFYALDCTKSIWATDKIHDAYHQAGFPWSDVDWVIETENDFLLVEYKNAAVPGAANPAKFDLSKGDIAEKVSRSLALKYYDSQHFLSLLQTKKPKRYICVLEFPNGDYRIRQNMCVLVSEKILSLPGCMSPIETLEKPVESVEVLSINEWNHHPLYGRYPLRRASPAGTENFS